MRIFKLGRYTDGSALLRETLRASSAAVGLMAFFMIIITLLFASIVYFAEMGRFKVSPVHLLSLRVLFLSSSFPYIGFAPFYHSLLSPSSTPPSLSKTGVPRWQLLSSQRARRGARALAFYFHSSGGLLGDYDGDNGGM